MSEQLRLSATFSVIAMAAFAVFAVCETMVLESTTRTGAEAFASAPELARQGITPPHSRG